MPITVSLAGDGQTHTAEITIIFDEARLSLPVASGEIPSASQNGGHCIRVNSNTVKVWRFATSAVPNRATVLCQFPFSITAYAPVGSSPFKSTQVGCYSNSGAQTCSVELGRITVSGLPPLPPPAMPERNAVSALLSAAMGAPTVEMLTGFEFGAGPPPLPVLGNVQFKGIKALTLPRAKGDFKAYLDANPNTARAKLERYVVIEYNNASDAAAGLAGLQSEPYILYASPVKNMEFATAPGGMPGPYNPAHTANQASNATKGGGATNEQYHLQALNLPAAWQRAGGWSLVGVVDTGLDATHPDLVPFVNGSFTGGNFLQVYSADTGYGGGNVDERRPIVATPADIGLGCSLPATDPVCQTHTPGFACILPPFSGHGTHVSGLVASNSNGPAGIRGSCRDCGVGMMKAVQFDCSRSSAGISTLRFFVPIDLIGRSASNLSQISAQVINMSLGTSGFAQSYCASNPLELICIALEFAESIDVLSVASAGNFRQDVRFAAHDARVLDVGGLDETLQFWDESPGNTTNCPYAPSNQECGSNFTVTANTRRQELTAPARRVRSLFYRGGELNADIACTDLAGDGLNNGVGLCTGTSMSAPIIAGLAGLLRSVNPLVRKGNSEHNIVYGIRNVLRDSASPSDGTTGWNTRYGYGLPNADMAVQTMLGEVRGEIVRNRVTPLFTLRSTGAGDYASVATPQAAMSLIRYSAAAYTANIDPLAPLTPGYSVFPHEGTLTPPAPRANAYVLTTEFDPRNGSQLTPLYLLDRSRNWPLNCSPLFPPCNEQHRDFLLISNVQHLETAVAQGYNYRGRQGYIYPRCSPEPSCQPPGTQKLYRQCNTSQDDCAIFLESQLSNYTVQGYTAAYPSGTDPVMGYTYPNMDSDSDGLVDGMEYVIGTDPFDANSDDDMATDGQEFPQAAISFSDPCDGPNITCTAVANGIFANGFE